MAWLYSRPKHHKKHEDPPTRLESLHEDDPVREMPEANALITTCFNLSGMFSASGMGMAPLSWCDIDAFCRRSGYELDGWQAEQLIMMSRAYCSMSNDAKEITCAAPYNKAASDEYAMEQNRARVNAMFKSMSARQREA